MDVFFSTNYVHADAGCRGHVRVEIYLWTLVITAMGQICTFTVNLGLGFVCSRNCGCHNGHVITI